MCCIELELTKNELLNSRLSRILGLYFELIENNFFEFWLLSGDTRIFDEYFRHFLILRP
jgi:hypothetical protein